MNDQPRVTVAVMPREGYSYIERSLQSLAASTRVPYRLIVVDGKPMPWLTARMLERAAAREGFTLIRTEGYVTQNQARNLALRETTTEFFVSVDNDLIYADGWLEALLACADETGATVVGPIITAGYEDEPLFEEAHAAGVTARIIDDGKVRKFFEGPFYPEQPLERVQALVMREPCDAVEPHCFLVRRAVFESIGEFDEGFASTHEHIDLALSVRRAGGTVYLEPNAVIHELLPPQLPRGILSLPFYLQRWREDRNVSTLQHFCRKWVIPQDDDYVRIKENWLRTRRPKVFEKHFRLLAKFV